MPLAKLAGLDYHSLRMRRVKEHALSVGKEKRSENAQTPGTMDICSSFRGSRARFDSLNLFSRPSVKFTSRGLFRELFRWPAETIPPRRHSLWLP